MDSIETNQGWIAGDFYDIWDMICVGHMQEGDQDGGSSGGTKQKTIFLYANSSRSYILAISCKSYGNTLCDFNQFRSSWIEGAILILISIGAIGIHCSKFSFFYFTIRRMVKYCNRA